VKSVLTFLQRRRTNIIGAVLAIAAGAFCLVFEPLEAPLERLSFDLPFVFAPPVSLNEIVYVQRDEKAYRELKQDYGKLWDRGLYAQLLERLTADHARLAVFDILLADRGAPEKDKQLAEAIKRNGRLVLAVDYHDYSGVVGGEPVYPLEPFKDAAAGLGLTRVIPDDADRVVRQLYPGTETHPSLAWAAAKLAGARLPEGKARMETVRWMNYPSAADQVHRISFSEVFTQQPGYFTNRIVFVGGAPRTKFEGEQVDEFPSPFTKLGGPREPGAVLQMIAFLNLLRGDWLEELPLGLTWLLVLGVGALAGAGFPTLRPLLLLPAATACALLIFVGAAFAVFHFHGWFPWAIPALIQVPVALAWAAVLALRRPAPQPAPALPLSSESVATVLQTITTEAPVSAQTSVLTAPDHKLLQCIGQGAYGQVWLAQDVIGSYHAIKFVFRNSFQDDRPFEREFHGMQQFTPISRMHPGLVHVLHVGRNENAGHFFYIMEAGDDEKTGQAINPNTYVAKTLGRAVRLQGRLSPTACIQLGLDLSSALAFLHEQGLIHRDIKPSNIIFVHGKPKLADVGLVTRIATEAAHHTYIGTEGYIAPEGPGTPVADVYSLGMVLYEAAMGLDRMKFPAVPETALGEGGSLLLDLKQVILKACEFNCRARYATAQELHDALKALVR
jgi:CHASE2 domain-containing sensor protein